MAFRRVVLQPMMTTANNVTQEVRFAVQTTGWKTGYFWANLPVHGGTAVTFDIRGASGQNVSEATAFWPSLGTFVTTAGTPGAYKSNALTPLPDFVRFITTGVSASITFELIAYLWDV